MAIETFAEMNCSIGRTMSFLGERWTPLVLRELFFGNRRFESIQTELGVASNILSSRLNTLLEEGIVERHRYSERPERFEYRLTEKGLDLQPVMLAIQAWGDRHTAPDGAPLDLVHLDCGHVVHAVPACDHCGEELTARNVRPQAGPGANAHQRERAARRDAEEAERRAAATK
jgi:DNA-binding HxlR family transcriptional regulator